MTRPSRRERLAQARLITAALAVAELEATFGEDPAANSDVMVELRQARRGLYQVVVAGGRRG